jgi:hypothetical protein
MAVLYKSCRIFHIESNKIGFAFFWFFYDFLRIFKVSAKALYYLRFGFTGRPLELLFLLQIGPWFTKKTLERMRETQLGPWPWRRQLRPKLGGSGGGFGRGRGGEGRGAYQQPVCGAEERRQLAGQRRTGSTAAAGSAPADSQSGKRQGRHREVVGV